MHQGRMKRGGALTTPYMTLERILQGKFDDALPKFSVRNTKLLVRVNPLTGRILLHRQVKSAAVGIERPKWMIQEVKRREPELHVLPLGEFKRLVDGGVTVEKRRPVDIGQLVGAIHAGSNGAVTWHAKTRAVDVLVRSKIGCRIAQQYWLQINVGRAQHRSVADGVG